MPISRTAPRLETLDGLRGVAVMAILLMNAAGMGLPRDAYLHPALGIASPLDAGVWAAEFVLVDGKFRNLFAFLFGAGIVLVAERAEAAGRSGATAHYRRIAWLLPIGLAHLYLLWWGDILHHYALVGAAAFLFRDRPPHALVALGLVVLLLDTLLLGNAALGGFALHAAAGAPGATPEVVARWRESGFVLDAGAIRHEIAVMRGPYGGILRDRWATDAALPLDELVAAGPETFALMLFGMAGLRSGFVTGAWPRARYRRVALVGYAAGLPAMAGLAGWCVASGFDPPTCFAVLFALSLPFRAPLMLAHAALLIPWLAGARAARLRAVGRMALSNYLLSSFVMTTLFYGYGAGRFATLGHAGLLAPVMVAWAGMLLWSEPWLARFGLGPAEWLWRTLARGDRRRGQQ